MGLTHIFSFIDYSSTINDSFEVGYSIIKNGGTGRDSLAGMGTLDKDFFEKVPFNHYINLHNKLFNKSSYNNLPIPRFGDEEVYIQSMGIYSPNREGSYKKYAFQDCYLDFSLITPSSINVYIKEVTCAKMLNTPIWLYVDKKLIDDTSSYICIFTMRVNRDKTPTMMSLIVDVPEIEVREVFE